MNSQIQYSLLKRLLMPVFLFIITIIFVIPVKAQEKPPKPIIVTVDLVQNLNFGTFCIGNGTGTKVIISSQGLRSYEGNIVLISSSVSAALYIVKAIPGTLIIIQPGPDEILTGSNGGTMTMKIGDSYPLSPLITTDFETPVTIGGTLIVGDSNTSKPGAYHGTFQVTFIQQ